MRFARATRMMRRTDYLPAYYRGKPVWVGAYRPRRPPRREGEHRIFTDRRTGRTLHAVFDRATPTHWLVHRHRSRARPNAVTRLERSRWSAAWKVCEVWFSNPAR